MLIETIIATRETTHGVYREQASLAQNLKRLLRSTRNWERLDYYQAQSIEAFCDKLSRILNGDMNELDHWRDISGYACLVLKELEAQTGGDMQPEVPNAKMPVSMKKAPEDAPLNAPEFLLKQMEEDLKNELDKK